MSNLVTKPNHEIVFNESRYRRLYVESAGCQLMAFICLMVLVVSSTSSLTKDGAYVYVWMITQVAAVFMGLLSLRLWNKRRHQVKDEYRVREFTDQLLLDFSRLLGGTMNIGEKRMFGSFDNISISVIRSEQGWHITVFEPIVTIQPVQLFSFRIMKDRLLLYLPPKSKLGVSRSALLLAVNDASSVIIGQSELQELVPDRSSTVLR